MKNLILFLSQISTLIKQDTYYRLKYLKIMMLSIFLVFIAIPSTANAAFYDIIDNNYDAEERVSDGYMYRDSSDLEMPYDGSTEQIVGMRFNNVSIPVGAIITKAIIHFRADETDSGAITLEIYGDLANDAAAIGSSDYDLSSRTATSASKLWNPGDWTSVGSYHNTSDFSNVMQEIVNQPGFAGDDVVIMIKRSSGDSTRVAYSRNGDSSKAPRLEVEYTLITTPVPPLMGAIPDQPATKDDPYSLDLSTFVTPTNGDPIISYGLTGSLPVGLSFDSNTGIISGTPTVTGTFSLSATATDKDGISNASSFDLTVADAPLTCANYDTSSNDSCPGNIVISMNDVNISKARCIYGTATDSSDPHENYHFTVQAFGTLDVSANTENDSAFYFGVSSSCGSYDYYDGVNPSSIKNHTAPTIDLVPGDTVYFYIKESGSGDDDYRIDFDFKVDTTFYAANDNYSTAINKSVEMDVLRNDNPGVNVPLDTTTLTVTSGPSHGTIVISNGIITYTPALDYIGSDTFTYTIKDSVGTVSNEATVSIEIGTIYSEGDTDFTTRNPENSRNIKGNYVIGGNMNLCEEDPYNAGHCRTDNSNSNSRDDIYMDIDGDSSTKNSTSFDLDIPSGSKVVWAGLYWQGVIHRSFNNGDFMGGTVPSDAPLLGGDTNQINLTDNTYGAEIVKLKIGNTNYVEVVADQLYYSKLGYGGYADVTHLLDVNNPNETYMLADIKCHTGNEPNHGNYGGWALVVIYESEDEDFKNITLFDGFATVDSSYNGNLLIDGFLTPKKGPIYSKIAFFTMDGEGGTNSLEIISEKLNKTTKVSGPNNPADSLFNSTIQGVNNRQPNNPSLRFDLDIIDLVDVLGESETKATLQPRTEGDRYTASFFIMSSDLIAPELCYDYDVHVGDVKINSQERALDTNIRGNEPLELKILIRSMVADFTFQHAKANIIFTPTPDTPNSDKGLEYIAGASEISPARINAYIPAAETNTSKGQIAIGHYLTYDDAKLNGGTIDQNESTYFKQDFDFNDTSFEGRFDIVVEGDVDYLNDNNPFHYNLTTKNGSISRCPTNPVYNPIEADFNIENAVAGATDPKWDRYPLYTQVTGRPYQVVLASYTKDGNGDFTARHPSNATVEVEVIDAASYDNNASTGYDSTCQEPTAASEGGFLKLNNQDRLTFEPFNLGAYNQTLSLRSAAFRIWILTQKDPAGGSDDRLIVEHACVNAEDNGCFENLYDSTYETQEDNQTKFCDTDCNTRVTNTSQCYDCLRQYFAIPICSRDNFSIRPESFLINIGDNKDPHDETVPTKWFAQNKSLNDTKNMAAGYEYPLEINATNFNQSDTISKGYHNDQFKHGNYLNLPDIHSGVSIASLKFNDDTSCSDKNSTTLSLSFLYSSLEGKYYLKNHNAGEYKFTISDSNWTEVDQARYNFKPEFGAGKQNDCDITSSAVNTSKTDKVGCTIYSVLGSKTEMTLDFKPDRFYLSVDYHNRPNTSNTYLYMNDLESPNVDDRMAAKMEGNITALGTDGITLSNFTNGCAAENVLLWVDRTMIPDESTITGENGADIHFQQGLKGDNDILVVLNNASSNDINSTLGKVNFTNTSASNGSAEVDLYFNFSKPYAEFVNPIDVNFSMLLAASPNATSNAHMKDDYIPDGNTTNISQPSILFYFAKVSPLDTVMGEQVYTLSTSSIIKVNTYCRDIPGVINCGLSAGLTSLEEGSGGTTGGWYRMGSHLSASGDGQVNSLSTTTSGVTINGTNPLNNVTFDTNGSTSNISFAYPLTGRPVHPVFVIDPDEWLKYDSNASKNGLPEFIINFLTPGLKWKGEGKTGHVVETEPSTGSNSRINW